MNARLIPAFAFLAAAAFAPQAGAANVAFHYNTSELASTAGLNAVYSRINRRAENACMTNDLREVWRRNAEAACASALVEDIVSRIDNSSLSTLHAQAAASRFALR